ncbi:MAG: hypothetical protein RLZZ519_738 [Bacteroidota bacterium]|jgi:hypothetical protein
MANRYNIPDEDYVLQRICTHSEEWTKRFIDNWTDAGHYRQMSEIAQLIVRDVAAKRNLRRVQKVFDTLEELLVEFQDGGTALDLLGAGLMEYLQERVRGGGLEPPDALNAFMGPKFKADWVLTLQGWFGKGITTIDRLNRILIGNNVSKIQIQFSKTGTTMEITGGRTGHIEQRILYERQLGEVKIVQEMGLDDPFATVMLDVSGCKFPQSILIGNRLEVDKPTRYVSYENELFALNFEGFLNEFLEY